MTPQPVISYVVVQSLLVSFVSMVIVAGLLTAWFRSRRQAGHGGDE